jgi:putative endonuclease
MTNQELGAFGEGLAKKLLEEKGYLTLFSNWRHKHLELDLVCSYKDKLIVVEVKTRQTAEIGEPWEAVTKSKQKQLIRAANIFIKEYNVVLETQFDIVSIVHNSHQTRIEHIEDAFTT